MRGLAAFAVGAFGLVAWSVAAGAAPARCANPNAIGVARTVEIDTTAGPGFGFEHYKANDFLQPKEVVLTFDDGPQKFSTEAVLAGLAEHCTKATFFSIGKMALGYPEIIREVAKAGHTVGTHTWSHKAIRKLKTFEEGRDEIERGVSAVRRAVGGPIAPFFRYPTLQDTAESVAHLGKRNIAMFSTDIDSFDFKIQTPESIVKTVMAKLDKQGKGIILMHDIHKTTAKAVPLLLTALKNGGYKVVHMKPKAEVATLAEFDAAIEKDAKGLPQAGAERAVSSIVKTIEGDAPPAEKAAETPPATSVGSQKAAAPPPAAEPAPAPTKVAAPAADATAAAADESSEPPQAATQAKAPETTGSINAAAGEGEPPAQSPPAPPADAAPKSWSARVVEIWQMWFGK